MLVLLGVPALAAVESGLPGAGVGHCAVGAVRGVGGASLVGRDLRLMVGLFRGEEGGGQVGVVVGICVHPSACGGGGVGLGLKGWVCCRGHFVLVVAYESVVCMVLLRVCIMYRWWRGEAG